MASNPRINSFASLVVPTTETTMSSCPLLALIPAHAVIEADLRPLDRRENPPRLVLVRGLPGSGKSTLAANLRTLAYLHFEADQFFVSDGSYRFDARFLGLAHRQCQQKAAQALVAGTHVVVSNTCTRMSELAPYLSMTRDAVVLRTCGPWTNVHEVPASRVLQMSSRWEPFEHQPTTMVVKLNAAAAASVSKRKVVAKHAVAERSEYHVQNSR